MSISRDLRDIPFFSGFTKAEAMAIAELMEEKEYQEGEVIFDEKTPHDCLFFILKGRVTIFKEVRGTGNFLTILEKDDLFGEVSFIDAKAPSASAKAIEAVRLGIFTPLQFKKISEANPALGIKFMFQLMRELARRFRIVNEGTDIKSPAQIIADLIQAGAQVRITTQTTEYICKIVYADKDIINSILKIDIKGFQILVPFSQVKAISLPNKDGKYL
ncbi:MAG: Crp/Fnr family transcriptional regulator [Candidatus Ozemobacteraceae bacterium]